MCSSVIPQFMTFENSADNIAVTHRELIGSLLDHIHHAVSLGSILRLHCRSGVRSPFNSLRPYPIVIESDVNLAPSLNHSSEYPMLLAASKLLLVASTVASILEPLILPSFQHFQSHLINVM
jgi:hypothetical protein